MKWKNMDLCHYPKTFEPQQLTISLPVQVLYMSTSLFFLAYNDTLVWE